MSNISILKTLALVCIAQGSMGFADNKGELLDSLRRYDASISTVTVESMWTVPAHSTGSFPVTYSATFTQTSGTNMLELDFKELQIHSSDRYEKGQLKRFPGVPALVFRETHINSTDVTGFQTLMSTEPRKTINELAKNVPSRDRNTGITRYVYSPEAADTLHRIMISQWCLGRGYSDYLTEIMSCESRKEGLVKVSGRGFTPGVESGVWTLWLDPDCSLLVRRAEFQADGRAEPDVRVEIEGEVESVGRDPSVILGRHATYIRPSTPEAVFRIENTKVDRRFDERLNSVVRSRFGEELPPRSMLFDRRGEKEVIRRVGGRVGELDAI